MALNEQQKQMMVVAFEGTDSTLPQQWRGLICALRDEIRARDYRIVELEQDLDVYQGILATIPGYEEKDEPPGYAIEWIGRATQMFLTIATIQMAMQDEIAGKPKTTRGRKKRVESEEG
jgi:hypothetical protein